MGSAGEVVVVGGGVVGLTCALALARDGRAVTVLADVPPEATTSAVAAAIWFPYRAAPVDRVLAWSAATLRSFVDLAAAEPTAGVVLRDGLVLHRDPEPDLWWAPAVPGARRLPAAEVPAGYGSAVACTVPVIDMGTYLPWLAAACEAAGVVRRAREVRGLDEVPASADAVVVCAGLRSGALTGDDALLPVRGQVVRLANPGLTDWVLDEDDPAGPTYVVPRGADVVCGGTAQEGETDLEPDPAVEADVLRRAVALVPALAGAAVRSRAVGLRPARPEVRLERVSRSGRPVVCCYGHGGAGVTLAWGCAAEVAELVGEGLTGRP